MKPTRASFGKAHVMFVGPTEDDTNSEDVQKLKRVCELVKAEFILAGLSVGERRPLKLHCTLLNTVHRKPRATNAQRVPFSFADVLVSDAFKAISMEPTTSSTTINRMHGRIKTTFVGARADLTSNVAVKESSLEDADEMLHLDPTKVSLKNPPDSPAELGRTPWMRDMKPQGQRVDLGTYAVSEIQICKMGSWGAEGEYVCVGKICL
ncbi:hypothetical protein M0805_003367 [Coniferiporia weirii]|nr:hypothetical protein M0805_003367 [Coniferiporia weirii]